MRRHGVFFVYELLCSVQTKTKIFCSDTIYKLVQSQKAPVIVIPVKTGIQENHPLKDSRSPIRSRTSFVGVTALETFYETITIYPLTSLVLHLTCLQAE